MTCVRHVHGGEMRVCETYQLETAMPWSTDMLGFHWRVSGARAILKFKFKIQVHSRCEPTNMMYIRV